MTSPSCLVNGLSTLNGVNVSASSLVTIQLNDLTGVNSWIIKCTNTDNLQSATTITAGLSINNLTKTATFTMPANIKGSSIQFTSIVNNGQNVDGSINNAFTTTFGIFVLNNSTNLRKIFTNQTTEGNAAFGWGLDFNSLIELGVNAISIQGNPVQYKTLGPAQDGYVLYWNNSDGYLEWLSQAVETVNMAGDVIGTTAASKIVSLVGVVTLEMYGAVGDGTTNDTAAYVAAVASGKTIMLGAKTYKLVGTSGWAVASITTPGQGIFGHGDQSVLNITNNYAAVDASSGAGLNVFKNFRILGSSSGTSQHGITVAHDAPATGQSRIFVDGVVFENLGGRGISLEYTSISFQGPRVSNCLAYNCLYGYYVAVSDYPTFSNCVAMNCSTGLYAATGNLIWMGGSISANTGGSGYGIYWDVSVNDGHSQIIGTELNHNTIAVQVGAINNGLSFVGCNIYYGTIVTNTSLSSVVFRNCFIDVTSITGASSTRFDNCTWPMANSNTPSGGVLFNPGNVLLDGTGFALSDVSLDNGSAHNINMKFAGITKVSIEPTHGILRAGNGGTDYSIAIGPLKTVESNYSGIWFLSNAQAITEGNVALYSDGSSLILNSPVASGVLDFFTGQSVHMMKFSGGTTNTTLYQPVWQWDSLVANPSLSQIAAVSDVATYSLTIKSQDAFSSAVTNKNGGDIAVTPGISVATGVPGKVKLSGGITNSVRAISTTYTVDANTTGDYALETDTSSSGFTITLPTPVSGRVLKFIDQKGKWATNNLTIAPHGAEKIKGLAANLVLSAAWNTITLISDGTDWQSV